MAIQFKDESLRQEYTSLALRNWRLFNLLSALEVFVRLELKKDLIITEIYRDAATNSAQGGIANSPHMTWEGVDIRSWIYTEAEIQRILAFLNTFTFRNGKQVGVYHAVKNGAPHFHIQYGK